MCLIPLTLLGGCAAMAERDAIQKANAHCALEGKQFVQQTLESHEGLIVSDAAVTGVCLGPNDPGYKRDQPATPAKP